MVNSERNLTLLQPSIPPAGQARPDWQLICQVAAQLGFGEHFDFASSEQVFDEIRRFSNPQTGYDLRGVSYARLRQTPLQWPCPPDDDGDRHPIRYLNDGVSQDLFVDADGHRPRLAFPTPSRRAVFHARPHMDARRVARRRFPVGAQHRSAAAPVAHDDQDRQGRQAEQARQRAVRRTPSRRRAAMGIAEGQPVELDVPAGSRRAACRRHRTGAAGQLLRAVSLERRARRVPDRQRGHQRRRRRGLPAARVQGLRGTGASGRTRAHPGRSHSGCRRGPRTTGAVGVADRQCRGLRGRLARRLGDSQLVNMDDVPLSRLAAARDVVIVTSTFGDGGPPDNGADFWDRLGGRDAPALDGVRYAVLGIGDRSYADFCGHAKSIDGRFTDLGASKLLDRAECEAYDDGPMVEVGRGRRRAWGWPSNRTLSSTNRSPAPTPCTPSSAATPY